MFERRGVQRLAMFDIAPSLVGKTVAGIPVLPASEIEEYCRQNQVSIGVLTTPKDVAPEMARRLASAGVRGIWNFSNMELRLEDEGVVIENMHLGDSLMKLCFELKSKAAEEKE